LLHFKLNGNLIDSSKTEAEREEHFNNAAEYKLYLKAINAGKFQFNKECEKWSNTNKLIQDGLISVTDEWLKYLEKQGATFEANTIENEKKFQILSLWPSVVHAISDEF
jgi:ribosomal protein L6P/L9E